MKKNPRNACIVALDVNGRYAQLAKLKPVPVPAGVR